MNDKFDELTKDLAQSVTRRRGLAKFGLALAGLALAPLGLTSRAQAQQPPFQCQCRKPVFGCDPNSSLFGDCYYYCKTKCYKPNKHSHCC